ncbi:unnamed protein product, partial [Prorocentrum cordatum]
VNEWYLFHGCHEKAAHSISTHDFKISAAMRPGGESLPAQAAPGPPAAPEGGWAGCRGGVAEPGRRRLPPEGFRGCAFARAGARSGAGAGLGTLRHESCTKADEYSKPNSQDEFCLLLCRALGGNVRYTAAVTPDPDALVKDCIEGPYECILGDREKCRNTFREFVFYDTENLFAEYIINYKRVWT